MHRKLPIYKSTFIDGTRQSIGSDVKILFTIKDGNQQRLVWDYHPSGTMFKVPFYDNFG